MEPVPTATPTVASGPLTNYDVDTLSERTYDLTIMLAEELSPRQSATEEELQAAMFLMEELEALGYATELQDFEVTEVGPAGSIEVLPNDDEFEARLQFSRPDGDTPRISFLPFDPVKTGSVQGELVYVGLGDHSDYEGIDAEGKIALASRGTLTFEDKESNAAENGAVGIVVFNNEQFYFGGLLSEEPDVLAGGIPLLDGLLLVDALDNGDVVNVELLAYPDGDGPSRNVIAELNNDIVGDEVLIIGAHYDTTPWSAGANDNGSGVASALIVAEELADDVLPFDLRFVFFGSEETGLHGSHHYAWGLSVDEVVRIAGMINLDVVATGDLLVFGDSTLTSYAEMAADTYQVDIEATMPFEWGASDYAAFHERGIPYIMFYADELDYINHPSDTVEHVEPEPLGGTVATVLGIVELLAQSIKP